MCAHFPLAMCFPGGSMSCHFFSDQLRIISINLGIVLNYLFWYFKTLTFPQQPVWNHADSITFLAANHAIHAQFLVYISSFNDDHKIVLLHGADTCFVNWFYAMHKLFKLKRSLKAIMHGVAFESVAKSAWVVLETKDVKDEVFWKIIFCLLWDVIPALKALR